MLGGGTGGGSRWVVAPEVGHIRLWHRAPVTANDGGSLPAPGLGGEHLGRVAILGGRPYSIRLLD